MRGGHGSDPLVIKRLDFLGGMTATGGYHPDGELPEVAFAGRSNVGKSSLLNALVRRRKAARVSKAPGRTREINFFRVNDRFVLADLPGYGYARVPLEVRASWRILISRYLRGNAALRGVVLLLDVRRDPSPEDRHMIDLLAELELPVLAVITKVDKLSARRASERMAAIRLELELDEDQVIPFSALTGVGRDDLAASVLALVDAQPEGM